MMDKKTWKKIGLATLVLLVIAGFITNYIDSGRVTTGREPKWCIKTVNDSGNKVTYWGLGYKVVRYVGVSPNEPYENNIGAKMGSWFMKYDLPTEQDIKIEYDGKTVVIDNREDRDKIYNILTNSKYDSEICNGIHTHKITVDNEVYYLKQNCQAIQRKDKQAKISKEDVEAIIKMMEAVDNKE